MVNFARQGRARATQFYHKWGELSIGKMTKIFNRIMA